MKPGGATRVSRHAFWLLVLAAMLPGAGCGETGRLAIVAPQEFAKVLEAERGNIVVLNLWATWCVPCLKEIPDLMQLERDMARDGVRLVALGMDDPADFARVDEFRRQHFPAFESYLRGSPDMDTIVSVVDPVWNELLPTTYLIDRDGSVARRIQGKKTLEDFQREVTRLVERTDRG